MSDETMAGQEPVTESDGQAPEGGQETKTFDAGYVKQLRDEARRFLSENSTPKHVRAILEGKDAYDRALWKGLAELGLIGVAIPEEFGGAGAGLRRGWCLNSRHLDQRPPP